MVSVIAIILEVLECTAPISREVVLSAIVLVQLQHSLLGLSGFLGSVVICL